MPNNRTATPARTAQIYIAGDITTIHSACREYFDAAPGCVSISPVDYVFTGGAESGACVTLIAYARFPDADIDARAFELAEYLLLKCCQRSCSVLTQDSSTYIEREMCVAR